MRLADASVASVLLVAVLIVCWPGLQADWGRDDYFQFAFARLLGSPWPLFLHDHFPVPGSVYRPLGFASMWLEARLFGVAYFPHAVCALALHAAVTLVLLALLRRFAVSPLPALAASLLFALHPLATGTALWWSARFDLLATLFVLLAMLAAQLHAKRPSRVALVATLLAALGAMLSKEIGLVVVPAVAMQWWLQGRSDPVRLRRAWRDSALLLLVAIAFLGWRAHVLGTAASGLTGTLALGDALLRGVAAWGRQVTGYLAFRADIGGAGFAAALLLLVTAVVVVARGRYRESIALAVAGACLLLVPAVLQAPVAAQNALPLRDDMSAVEVAMQSRLYYLGLAGVALVVAALLRRIGDMGPRARLAGAAAVLLPIVFWAMRSHEVSRAFADIALRNAEVAHEAADAMARMDVSGRACHVVFVGVPQPAEWGGFVSMDSVVKALSPDPERFAHCWIHADYPTWFHLMRAPVSVADSAPWRPLEIDGMTVPWLRVGDVEYAYLAARGEAAFANDPRVRLLAWDGRRFVDAAAGNPVGMHPSR